MGHVTDWRAGVDGVEGMTKRVETEVVGSRVAWTFDTKIEYSTVLALNLAPRIAIITVAAAKIGDRVYVHRRAKPTLAGVNVAAGIILEGTGAIWETGKVEVYHVIPAVGLGQTLTIPLKLIGYRPSA